MIGFKVLLKKDFCFAWQRVATASLLEGGWHDAGVTEGVKRLLQ